MRFHAFVAAAALLPASLAAHADSYHLTVPIPLYYAAENHYTYETSGFVAPFYPAEGTLNSVSVSLNGSYLLTSAPDYITFEAEYDDTGFNVPDLIPQPGINTVSMSKTFTDPTLLQAALKSQEVFFELDGYDLTNIDVTGTLTFNYTPVAATPEPSSIALLSTGLLGVAGVVRKRFA